MYGSIPDRITPDLKRWRSRIAAGGEYSYAVLPEAREFMLLGLLNADQDDNQYVWIFDSVQQAERAYGVLQTWISLFDLGQSSKNSIALLKQGNWQPLARFTQGKVKLLILDKRLLEIKVPSEKEIVSTGFLLSREDKLSIIAVFDRLRVMGYVPCEIVTQPAETTKRGGIIDVYPRHLDYPVRIEFWGDQVASLRLFDPHDQRSLQTGQNAMESLHIPSIESPRFTGSLREYFRGVHSICDEQAANEVKSFLEHPASFGSLTADASGFQDIESARGRLSVFFHMLAKDVEAGNEVFVISTQARRLQQTLEDYSNRIFGRKLEKQLLHTIHFSELAHDQYAPTGFSYPSVKTVYYTDHEIFGIVQAHAPHVGYLRKRYKRFLNDIRQGDLVVHDDYGVCIFEKLTRMQAAGREGEYLLLVFGQGDRLFLPTAQIYKLSKYIGKDKDQIDLQRLGTKKWTREKHKAEKDTAQLAHDLLQLYVRRNQVSGFSFPPDEYLQKELAASFPYLETPDQLRAIADVTGDMESSRPMDRLICGDVGFGKTEIAIRAAGKAVASGKQVAYLCPTTILAEQHYATFTERLDQFGIRIDMISRLKTEKHIRQVSKAIQAGTVDIVIGTHRLLSGDIHYKDLGLLIIDEEQRFGVEQKEKIKQLRSSIDVLTLSATPIPRTLNLALTGVRDVSLISSPPQGRLPIRTFVMPYGDPVVRDAVEKELARRGQVFIVYNRVRSIASFSQTVAALVPKARVAYSHGQLDSEELEEKMYGFVHGKTDVLVTSTIIENGVDIPAANTMIVIGAEDFGLASLYQLRGRIGRSDQQAYAYFLTKHEEISREAAKRLEAITEASELGSGLSLALRDLEIRGVGNILGAEQSGHIDGVGYELYTRLLQKSIDSQKQVIDQKTADTQPVQSLSLAAVTVELPLSAYIPDDYIQSDSEKMSLYQHLSEIDTVADIQKVTVEMSDRFGPLPEVVQNLLTILKLRILAAKHAIDKIWVKNGILQYQFTAKPVADYISRLQALHRDWKLEGRLARIHFNKIRDSWLTTVENSLS